MIIEDEDGVPYWQAAEGVAFPIWLDDEGDAVIEDDFGEIRVVATAVELAEADHADWVEPAKDSMASLEHRLGRELTVAEKQTVVDDLAKSGEVDAIDAFVAHYPEGRSRRELAAEVVRDSWNADAEEEDTEPERAPEGATTREQLANAVEESNAEEQGGQEPDTEDSGEAEAA